jgi:uncharacterized protein (DUF302 family)
MLIKIPTKKSLQQTAIDLPAAIQANHFGLMHTHNLRETMTRKGVAFTNECLVFEVCNPQQAKKVLERDMGISTALPCRISVYEEGGRTILATIRPSMLLALFQAPQLAPVAAEVEATMMKIMREAAA